MAIGLGNIQSIGNAVPKPKVTANEDVNQFGNVFKGLIDNVMESQAESSELTKKLIQGGDVELHEVMIAGEKAKTNLQLLMEIRNKSLDMYKELTRIQI